MLFSALQDRHVCNSRDMPLNHEHIAFSQLCLVSHQSSPVDLLRVRVKQYQVL